MFRWRPREGGRPLPSYGMVRHVWLCVCKPTHDVACDEGETLLVRGLSWSAAISLTAFARGCLPKPTLLQ